MKTILVFLVNVFLVSFSSANTEFYHFDCKAVKISSGNLFDEGLSTDEYPDVYMMSKNKDSDNRVNQLIGYIGAYRFDRKKGDTLVHLNRRSDKLNFFKFKLSNQKWSAIISVSKNRTANGMKTGKLYTLENDERNQNATFVANLVCRY